ncbi:MAG: nucleoside triphosphate pyrophosphohydrolase [Actinomycetales bacterium]|nr:MAG: nucleoside triphosphate pyrophosphohydrolase [Actinomycetales bacterium]
MTETDQPASPKFGDPVSSESSRRPGDSLLDLVAVMDRLRSPGGCPWDARQTHASLVPYLVEETYEAVDAVDDLTRCEAGDPESSGYAARLADARRHVAEELGDVLLQVVFHSRVAQEHPSHPFDIDDVAAGIAAKLRRRHPHVFGDAHADTPEQVAANWAAIKEQERAEQSPTRPADEPRGPLEGIPRRMPPLARATRAIARADAIGAADQLTAALERQGDSGGGRLLQIVAELVRAGADPDTELRQALGVVFTDLGRTGLGSTD